MDTIYFLVRSTQSTVPARVGLSLLKHYWGALLDWHERQKLRARLHDLSERELRDIGTTRGEVDYVASHRFIDPRSVMQPK